MSASAAVGVESSSGSVIVTLDAEASSIVVDPNPGGAGIRLNEQSPNGPLFSTSTCLIPLNNTRTMICVGSFQDLHLQDNGQAGPRDTIDASMSPIPLITGGAGGSLLSPVTITGSAFNDSLHGSNESDQMSGGNGNDELSGLGGSDTIDALDGVADTVDCGPDLDSAKVDPIDTTVNCEYPLVVVDGDQDGVTTEEDCDDKDPAIKPGATDIPGNGVDEDCSGADAVADADGDGHLATEDCDDKDATVYPGAPEKVGDGTDQDCSGSDTRFPDTDADGIAEPEDCDDKDAKIRPGALEIVGNKVDENCDKVVAPFPPIGSSVVSSFLLSGDKTRVTDLAVTDIPQGSSVHLACKAPKKAKTGCAFSSKSFSFAAGPRQSVSLEGSFKKRKLKVGTVITVTVTAPSMIGRQVQFKTRKGKQPTITSSTCAPPEGKTGMFCGDTDHF
ncbi:MAG: MopE-related protein [Solirubrobacterales bacterium]